jgi:5-dehydro-2-deoxygluconokinase
MDERTFDVIALGRAAVDFYGEQIGGRLEDMRSFAKYIGGSPCNTVIGASRLGLTTALISRVGDEQMGRFVRETLAAEGVDVSHVRSDPGRLTGIAILGIKDRQTFPLLFYRENCADMEIEEGDFTPEFIASARALLVSGTHFSTEKTYRVSRAAMRHARQAGVKVAWDIDFRPVLWGLTGRGMGENRFVASDRVTEHLRSILPDCDLVVGTEEEIHIAGGSTDTLAALRAIREVSAAVLVVKRGPMGCIVFPDAIPERLEDGLVGRGFPIEVFNVLGAGDAFMGGFLRGWLRDEPWETCCTYANACGAIVVSRHACSPEAPKWVELQDFLNNGSPHVRLREDPRLNHIHWSTNRRREWPQVLCVAFDHRRQFEELAVRNGVGRDRIPAFKDLVAEGVEQTAQGRDDMGVLLDDVYGFEPLCRMTGRGCWIARPVEVQGQVPVAFMAGDNVGLALREWPAEHVVKCLTYFHPDDPQDLMEIQLRRLAQLNEARLANQLELLVEVIPSLDRPNGGDTVARALAAIYGAGVRPDWWKLQPPPDAATWQAIEQVIGANDPYCRGVLLLGLAQPIATVGDSFVVARRSPLCRGFAVGRSVWGTAAEEWFAGRLGDAGVVSAVAENYGSLIAAWDAARG